MDNTKALGREMGTQMKPYKKLIALVLISATAGLVSAQEHEPKLIDTLMHYNGESGVLPKMLDKMEQVDGLAFLCVTPKGLSEARKFIHDHPDRFVGFGEVNLDDRDILQQIDRLHRDGFLGLGEISSTKQNYDDRTYWPIYERAQKYHMILHFHTGVVLREDPRQAQDVSFDRMRASRLDLIARRFPGLIIIGAHLGNPDYAEAAEIARWDPNLYFDITGSTLIKKKDDYAFFKSIFWWTGIASLHTPTSNASAFEKLVFGSDVFNGDIAEFDLELTRYHKMLDDCAVPQQAQDMIFSGTMWKILQYQREEMAHSK
jgi:predicted TIM-barrel fold metal-dependent hydrolase